MTQREAGELIEWDDARGFGFVRSGSGDRLFIHATAFDRAIRRPQPGDRLSFRRGPGRDGRPSVVSAQIAGATGHAAPSGERIERIERAQYASALRIALAAILLLALMAGRSLGHTPDWLLLAYGAMGVVSAFAYWNDKRAALAGRWRTRESTLHLLDFAGGIMGGLLAQVALGHKTAKPDFAIVTIIIWLAHLLGLAALALGVDLAALLA